MAETKAGSDTAFGFFIAAYGVKYDRAVKCLTKDRADLLRRCRAPDELLNETLFPSLAHARATLADWRMDYNVDRPHSGIGWQTPNEYAATFAPQTGSDAAPHDQLRAAPVAQPAHLGKTEHRSLAQVGWNLGATSGGKGRAWGNANRIFNGMGRFLVTVAACADTS